MDTEKVWKEEEKKAPKFSFSYLGENDNICRLFEKENIFFISLHRHLNCDLTLIKILWYFPLHCDYRPSTNGIKIFLLEMPKILVIFTQNIVWYITSYVRKFKLSKGFGTTQPPNIGCF
jgi:hypothetical protein